MGNTRPKVAFLISTFKRDELLYKSVEVLISLLQPNWMILIADQGEISDKKIKWAMQLKACLPNQFEYFKIPFNVGLSVARNRLVNAAHFRGCEYCVLSSDSFLFKNLTELDTLINNSKHIYGLDLIGFELKPSTCGWEAKLNLIENESFELDFIDKSNPYKDVIFYCDIVRNIFVAKTESLLKTQWDNNLRLGEHEDFFWRYKQNGFRVGWTRLIEAEKMTDRPTEYAEFRRKNFRDGIEKLKKKYNISGWVTYKNLERVKKDNV